MLNPLFGQNRPPTQKCLFFGIFSIPSLKNIKLGTHATNLFISFKILDAVAKKSYLRSDFWIFQLSSILNWRFGDHTRGNTPQILTGYLIDLILVNLNIPYACIFVPLFSLYRNNDVRGGAKSDQKQSQIQD